ncbi:MAG: hypothetical protein IT493_11995 [Gammaproteobacteria bacterium]|nr:hypothetical protein [Gammaproteobacteria bacterium]
MANTVLTSTKVTREALRILHQKLNFIGNVNRQYDDQFGQRGGKIGQQLLVRLPNKYTAATGRVITPQDTIERSVPLPNATQYNVPVQFTSAELGMSIDDFGSRILEPAMAVLAAKIEGDMLASVIPDVSNMVGTATSGGSPVNSLRVPLQARKSLADFLAPGSNRTMILSTQHNLDLVDALKGLFQDSGEISEQYRDGLVGRTAGFGKIYENTLLPRQLPGVITGSPTVNGASQGTATGWAATTSLITTAWTASQTNIVRRGDRIQIAGVFAVHSETKATLPFLRTFTVTADTNSAGAGAATIPLAPAIIYGGPYQNVSNTPANGAAITVLGSPTTITQYGQSLAFHKDAFIFATGKLQMPRNVHDSAQEEFDGVSMRFVTGFDVTNDLFISRFDVLCGWVTAYEELACVIAGN